MEPQCPHLENWANFISFIGLLWGLDQRHLLSGAQEALSIYQVPSILVCLWANQVICHQSRNMPCPKREHVTSLVMTTWSLQNKEQPHQASHWCTDERPEHSLRAGVHFMWTCTDSLSNGKITGPSSPFCLLYDPTHLSLSFQGLSVLILPAGTHTPLPSTTPVRGIIPSWVSGAERTLSQTISAADPSGFSGDQQFPRLELATAQGVSNEAKSRDLTKL